MILSSKLLKLLRMILSSKLLKLLKLIKSYHYMAGWRHNRNPSSGIFQIISGLFPSKLESMV